MRRTSIFSSTSPKRVETRIRTLKKGRTSFRRRRLMLVLPLKDAQFGAAGARVGRNFLIRGNDNLLKQRVTQPGRLSKSILDDTVFERVKCDDDQSPFFAESPH